MKKQKTDHDKKKGTELLQHPPKYDRKTMDIILKVITSLDKEFEIVHKCMIVVEAKKRHDISEQTTLYMLKSLEEGGEIYLPNAELYRIA